jgi:uncharacterized protein YajQ (UPF0234 family)
MSQRYDFKNSTSRIERNGAEITLNADDELKLSRCTSCYRAFRPPQNRRRVIDYSRWKRPPAAVRQKAF